MSKIVESLKKLSVENERQNNSGKHVKKNFDLSYAIEEVVHGNQNYVLSIDGTQSDTEFRIGVTLSDYSCVIYSVGESLNRTITLNHNKSPIVGVKFSPTSRNIVYTATNKGLITACDLRAKGKVVAEFKDNTEDGKLKPLASFDINSTERLLAGGTEHVAGDAFILFWDIRHSHSKVDNKSSLLGGYWESHMDDVTHLAFDSHKPSVLASGSTDGLINVFDLNQCTEEKALTYSLNTESSVDRVGWLTDNSLWCTTHTSLQLWDCDGATPYATFNQTGLATSQNEDPSNFYLVRVHATNSFGQKPFLLAGSSTIKGENLKCLSIVNDTLEPSYNMIGNKQIVRDSWVHEKSGCLITVGEGGIVNVWKESEMSMIQENAGHKLTAKIGTGKNRDRHHRTKPY